MKIIYINTENIEMSKDIIIKYSIKNELQYIEMENEVIIDCNYLFRFNKIEKNCSNNYLIDINYLENKLLKKQIEYITPNSSEYIIDNLSVPRFKKNTYKIESKKVKNKIKTKVNYNRRKY